MQYKEITINSVTENTTTTTVPNDEFETVLYTGNGTSQTISSANITSGIDFVWSKQRNGTVNNVLFDSIRGGDKVLLSDTTNVEATDATMITSFGTSGYSIGSNAGVNANTNTYVAWCASLPTDNASNTDGTITSVHPG